MRLSERLATRNRGFTDCTGVGRVQGVTVGERGLGRVREGFGGSGGEREG